MNKRGLNVELQRMSKHMQSSGQASHAAFLKRNKREEAHNKATNNVLAVALRSAGLIKEG